MPENHVHKKFNNNPLVTLSVSPGASPAQQQGPAPDAEWGIDYVSFSFPVDESQSSIASPLWTWEGSGKFLDSDKESLSRKAELMLGGAKVKVTYKPEYGRAYVAFNPSRAIKPKSAYLLPPGALKAVINSLLDELQDALYPTFDEVNVRDDVFTRHALWHEDICIHRLDAARNFYVDDAPAVKKALVNARPKYGKVNHLYWDRDGGWTLQNSTKKVGHDRIYDKYAELDGLIPDEGMKVKEGTFRFEAQLHKDRLKKFGLKTLADVSDERVWNALKTRWERCMWDVQVPEPGTALKAVQGLPMAKKEGLLGYLYLASQGATGDMTKEHIRERNRQAKCLNLQPGMDLYELGVPTRQLDLYCGELVPIVSDCDLDEAA
jgi:hypothetical protein